MKTTLTVVSLFLTVVAFAQHSNKDATTLYQPQVSDTVVNTIAISACNCMNKVDVQRLTTPEQKKTAMSNCLLQAANENATVIATDKNAEMTKGRDAGKQYGVVLGRKVVPLLMSDCPTFKLLVQ